MPTPLSSLTNSVERLMSRLFYIDYCTIIDIDTKGTPGVKCHSPDNPKYYNTVSLKIRSTKYNNENPAVVQHVDCIVLQRFTGNLFGEPYTPRVGDLVAVLFMYNCLPLVLGTVASIQQEPVFRAPTSDDARYDIVNKWCQWEMPSKDKNFDFYDHKPGKMPICEKLFHGPAGLDSVPPHAGRDEQKIWDCQKGHNEPTCADCKNIDSVPRDSEQWVKVYSTQTESEEAPNSRMELHARCGSYARMDSENGTSLEYSEGKGHIRIGNAVSESDKRGHINFKGNHESGAGTIDIHAEHEEVSFAAEQNGARMSVVNNQDSSVDFACETIYFDKSAYTRIMKNGQIVISTPEKITIESTGDEVLIKSPTKITLDAPEVEETHHNTNQSCTHGPCSCTSSSDGWSD